MWDEIIYPFSNNNGAAAKVYEWLMISSHTLLVIEYVSMGLNSPRRKKSDCVARTVSADCLAPLAVLPRRL